MWQGAPDILCRSRTPTSTCQSGASDLSGVVCRSPMDERKSSMARIYKLIHRPEDAQQSTRPRDLSRARGSRSSCRQPLRAADRREILLCVDQPRAPDRPACGLHQRPADPPAQGGKIARRITRNAGADVYATTLRSFPKCSIELAADTRSSFNSTNREPIV